MLDKTCNTCGKTFPATTEFFHAAKANKGGLNHKCKECIKIYGHSRYIKMRAAKPPKPKSNSDPNSISKTCSTCKIEKNKEDGFWKDKRSLDGYGYRCKDCSRKTTNKWRSSPEGKEKVYISGKTWRAENPEMVKASKKAYRDRDPERARAIVRKAIRKSNGKYRPQQWRAAIKRLYGLDAEEFYRLQEEQNNQCAICGLPEKDSRRDKLCVDHCHDTGTVRGLLCFGCNTILGNAQDNVELLESAIAYLKKFPKPAFSLY